MNKILKYANMYVVIPMAVLIAVENIMGAGMTAYETERLEKISKQEAYKYCLRTERNLAEDSLAARIMDFGAKQTNRLYLRSLEAKNEK